MWLYCGIIKHRGFGFGLRNGTNRTSCLSIRSTHIRPTIWITHRFIHFFFGGGVSGGDGDSSSLRRVTRVDWLRGLGSGSGLIRATEDRAGGTGERETYRVIRFGFRFRGRKSFFNEGTWISVYLSC